MNTADLYEKSVIDFLRDNAFLSNKHRLLYVSTPKVACTSLKWWFASIEGYTQALLSLRETAESDLDLLIHDNFYKVAPEVTGLSIDRLAEALTSDSYFRFALTRNPYKRVFSAWQSKLLLREPKQVEPYLRYEFLYHPIDRYQDVAHAFERFLEHLKYNEAPSFWDHHWTPQILLLRPDQIKYSVLAKIESPGELSRALAEWSSGRLSDPMSVARKNESLIPYQPEFVTRRSADMIRSLYAEDFRVFGYDTEPPLANVRFDESQLEVAIKAVKLIRARHERLGERAIQVAALRQTVADREVRVAELVKVVTQRDGEIAHRDASIANLNSALAERAQEIAGLSGALTRAKDEADARSGLVVERDKHIAYLTRLLAERAQEIAGLGGALSRAKDEANARSELVVERDKHIADLTRLLAKHDEAQSTLRESARESIAALEKTLAGANDQLHLFQKQLANVHKSRLWRIAALLRKVSEFVRYPLSLAKKSGRRATTSPKTRSANPLIRSSDLFDTLFYLDNNPDVTEAGIDPVTHYELYGWKEHRNPSRAFNTAAYLLANQDVAAAGLNPLAHYLLHGRSEGRSIEPPSLRGVEEEPSVPVGWVVEPAALDPVQIDKETDDIRNSGLFDEAYYLATNQDLQPALEDPIRHYCELGWREGRNPSDEFDTQFYLSMYHDIRNAGLNPFWHYVVAGANECRDALPDTAPKHEKDVRFGPVESDIKLIAFYRSPDWASAKGGRALFKGHAQPKTPDPELGQYDICDWQVLCRQASLAVSHGIHGLCFELSDSIAVEAQPIGILLAHNEIEIQFTVILDLTVACDVQTIARLLSRVFSDRRQIYIDDRPTLLVKTPIGSSHAPENLITLLKQLRIIGHKLPFLIQSRPGDSEESEDFIGVFDAALDLPFNPVPGETGNYTPVEKSGVGTVPYNVVASRAISLIESAQHNAPQVFHVVTLGRDNTACVAEAPVVYTRFHSRDYRRWLDSAMAEARVRHPEDRRLVFINAWNDWSKGLFLEPDATNGFNLLNETTRALLGFKHGLSFPKVSIVVPNYNHEPYLRRRLETIYRQTYKNVEVILLDDCSSDQSRSILEEYAAAYPEITTVFFNETNSGSPFRQWSKGIWTARGDLVWIAESDDYADEKFLEVLIRCFDDEAVLLAYGKSVFVDIDGVPLPHGDRFEDHIATLDCRDKWDGSYVTSAHEEVKTALGVKNTIPNVSGVVFRRPEDVPLLSDKSWQSMRVAGDWVFYLHVMRGGRVAFTPDAINFFRRYSGSTAELTYKKKIFYQEVGIASRTVAALYNVPLKTLEQCREACEASYRWHMPTGSTEEFDRWYDYESIIRARGTRDPNIMISTMGFYPGGAEILPIRIANELKRQGHSVLLFSTGLNNRQDGIRKMVRNDVPVVEGHREEFLRATIRDFGIEALNTHQWHVQKYPIQLPDVFDDLRTHVASLHGMIEHGDAFEVTEAQLRLADRHVTTWAYTAEKNIEPFRTRGMFDEHSGRFIKLPNGLMPPSEVVPVPRAQLDIPDEAFVLCCVSRAIPDKGWSEMIEAVGAARDLSGRDIRLILVGNGPVYDEYSRRGVPDFVRLTGFSADSVGHYAAADMGIMLTKFKSESFPLTIVDCLFAGRPFLACDVGDIRSMLTVENKIAGAVIKLQNWEVPVKKAASAIGSFAAKGKKYRNALALVEKAASRFRIDEVVSRYMQLFVAGKGNPKLGEREVNE